jgi:hypothetical protein
LFISVLDVCFYEPRKLEGTKKHGGKKGKNAKKKAERLSVNHCVSLSLWFKRTAIDGFNRRRAIKASAKPSASRFSAVKNAAT